MSKASNKLQLGLMLGLASGDMVRKFRKVADLGIPTCQISGTGEDIVNNGALAKVARAMADVPEVQVSSIFMIFQGQRYNLKDGPFTDGLVPQEHRQRRAELMLKGADLIKDLGVCTITSHIGFIPDDQQDPLYGRFLETMKRVAEHLQGNGQRLCFETGQELPSTLKRTIDDIGTGNMFVNLDPANVILYGKADPLDAVEIFGPWIRGMHAKDGLWPNRGQILGQEVPVGQGRVNWPLLMRRLKACGFTGPVTIEREITGPEQLSDIKQTIEFLTPLL